MNSKLGSFVLGVAVGGAVAAGSFLALARRDGVTSAITAPSPAAEIAPSRSNDPGAGLAAAEAKLSDLQTENVRLRAKIASLANATNAAVASSKGDGKPDFMKMFASAFGGDGGTNGEGGSFQKLVQAQIDNQINSQIARMKARLNLTPDQEVSIRALLTDQMKQGSELGIKMMNGSATPEEIQAAQKKTGETTDIKSLLTPEQQAEYAKLQVEDRQNSARLMANQNLLQIQNALGLTQDQQDKLYGIFYQSAESQLGASTDGTAPNPLDFRGKLDKELAAMKDILTPEQLDQYKSLQEQQITLMESLFTKGGK